MKLKCKRQNQYQPENKLLIKVISLLQKIRVTKFPKGISGDVISSKFPTNTPPVFHTETMQKQHSFKLFQHGMHAEYFYM